MTKRQITTNLPDGTSSTMRSAAKTVYHFAVIAQLDEGVAREQLAEWDAYVADGGYASWTDEERQRSRQRHLDDLAAAEQGRWFVVSHHGTLQAAVKAVANASAMAHLANVQLAETKVEEV